MNNWNHYFMSNAIIIGSVHKIPVQKPRKYAMSSKRLVYLNLWSINRTFPSWVCLYPFSLSLNNLFRIYFATLHKGYALIRSLYNFYSLSFIISKCHYLLKFCNVQHKTFFLHVSYPQKMKIMMTILLTVYLFNNLLFILMRFFLWVYKKVKVQNSWLF